MGKPLKEWGVVKFLKDKGLDVVEGFLDGGIMGAASELISKDDKLSETDKLEYLKELNSFQVSMAQEETKRIQQHHETERIQLQQEDLFTKRARPFRQYMWVLLLFCCYVLAPLFSGETIELPWEVIAGMFADMGVYTISRSNEKSGKSVSVPKIFGR